MSVNVDGLFGPIAVAAWLTLAGAGIYAFTHAEPPSPSATPSTQPAVVVTPAAGP